MNVAIVCLLLPLVISLLTIFRSGALRFTGQSAVAAERLPTSTDVAKLQHMLHDQLVYNQVQANNVSGVVTSLGVLGIGLIVLFCVNAFFLWKAHLLLKRNLLADEEN